MGDEDFGKQYLVITRSKAGDAMRTDCSSISSPVTNRRAFPDPTWRGGHVPDATLRCEIGLPLFPANHGVE